ETRQMVLAAVNGPWEESGSVVDLFTLSEGKNSPHPRRIHCQEIADSQATTNQILAFVDEDEDGFTDLTVLSISTLNGKETASPLEVFHYDQTLKTFSTAGSLSPREKLRKQVIDALRYPQDDLKEPIRNVVRQPGRLRRPPEPGPDPAETDGDGESV
ncbi:MAG: hypothetical protein AAF514_02030, partial [Verrucomicrobiota bacterium]